MRRLALALLPALAFAQAPVVSAIVNAASDDNRLAPGSIAIVRGTNLSSNVAATSVLIGNKAAFVESTSSVALLIQIPVDLPAGPTTLTVNIGLLASDRLNLTLSTLAPSIYTVQGQSPFFGSRGPVSPFNPAAPGDEVYCFATGLGPTDPDVVTGVPFRGTSAPTRSPVSVAIGDKAVAPDYAGLGAGYAPGLYIVAFRIPGSVDTGTPSVRLSIGGVDGNAVPIQVRRGQSAVDTIANGASFSPKGVVAGGILSIFANNLGSSDILSGFPATSVGGVSVLFNGIAAPILNVLPSIGRVDVVAPSELPSTGNVTIQVGNALGAGFPFPASMLAVDVGLFLVFDPSDPPRRNVAARFSNSAWLVMPLSMATALQLPTDCASRGRALPCGQPARAGDSLEIYFTGGGLATPGGDLMGKPLPTGQLAPADGNPLYQTVATPVVTIGGLPAKVLFSGLTPGSAGVYQVNVVVPDGVGLGDDVPLSVSLNQSTNTGTIAIRGAGDLP